MLDQLELWDTISEKELKPTDPVDLKEWLAKDRKARLIISNSVYDALITDIRKCKSAHAFWTRFEQPFRTKSCTNAVYHCQKIFLTKFVNGQDLEERFSQMRENHREAAYVGFEIPDGVLA